MADEPPGPHEVVVVAVLATGHLALVARRPGDFEALAALVAGDPSARWWAIPAGEGKGSSALAGFSVTRAEEQFDEQMSERRSSE